MLKIHNSLVHPEEKKDGQNVDLGSKDEVVHEHEAAKSDHLKKHIKFKSNAIINLQDIQINTQKLFMKELSHSSAKFVIMKLHIKQF